MDKKIDTTLVRLRSAYESDSGNVKKALNLVHYYLEHGRLSQAGDLLREALGRNPQDFDLLLEYGNFFFRNDEIEGAAGNFRLLTTLAPERIEGWNNLGIVLHQQGKTEEAKRCFDRVLKIDPDHPGALLNIGNFYFNESKFEKARSCFEKVLDKKPDFPDAWFNLGNTLSAQKDYAGAKAAFERALRYNPEFPSALKNLGFACEKLGELDNAEQCYLKGAENNKLDSGIHVNLGSLYIRQGKYDEAKRHYLKAVRLAPNNIMGWTGIRHLSLVKGDLNTFTRSTLAVLPRFSDEVLASSIEILYELHQFSRAEALLLQADRLGKGGDLLDIQRLLIYRRKGVNQGKVLAIYKRLSGLSKPSDQILKGLARFSLENGAYNSAINFVKRVENQDEASQGVLWRAMLGAKETEKVKELVEKYIKDNPECFDGWFILARIEAESGSRADAEKHLIRALENGFTGLEEIEDHAELRGIFESLTHLKTVFQDCLDKA